MDVKIASPAADIELLDLISNYLEHVHAMYHLSLHFQPTPTLLAYSLAHQFKFFILLAAHNNHSSPQIILWMIILIKICNSLLIQ